MGIKDVEGGGEAVVLFFLQPPKFKKSPKIFICNENRINFQHVWKGNV